MKENIMGKNRKSDLRRWIQQLISEIRKKTAKKYTQRLSTTTTTNVVCSYVPQVYKQN